jgi:molybdate transport system substrate-binding protein
VSNRFAGKGNEGERMRKVIFVLLFALGLLIPCFAQQSEIIVSAAASLTDVLSMLTPQAEYVVGSKVLLNFGGSGTLRKQIEEGAPVDVFFSAAREDMDALENKGMILTGTRKNLLSNAIVLITDLQTDPINEMQGLRTLLARSELLAIGNPEAVPAGRYAVQALKSLGLYDLVAKKLVYGGTVREVLQYVESGSAPFGIVFSTDALSVRPSSPVRQIFLFPDDGRSTPILYPIAVVAASKNREKAEKLVEFLQTAAARDAFRKAGFVVK